MAFEVKYRTEFTDIHGLDWKVEILENDFSGTVTTLTSTGDPITIYYDNKADHVFDPIRETHVDISVYSDVNFALQDLYSIDLLQFKVNIYADEELKFSGWIEPQNHREVYEPVSYPVTISATCGLSNLKIMPYEDDGEYYEGRQYESQVVLDILNKIGFTEFNEYVNVYEDNLDNTVDDSPFDQILIDVDIFREFSCIDVLTEILKKYNSFIRQKDGIFCIVRPKELIGATVYGRHFTAYDTKSSVTITPLQYINRQGYSSNRWQVPGGELMIQPPIRNYYINQDYGNLPSWIKNYNFDGDTLRGITLTGTYFDNWTNYGAPNVSVIGSISPGENEGCLIPYKATPDTNYIYQVFGHHGVESTTDMFAIEFDYMVHNTYSAVASNVQLVIQVYSFSGGDYLVEDDEETCSWDSSGSISVGLDALVGNTGWLNYKRIITGLPSDGPYVIKIFPLYNSSAYVSLGIKNVRFYASSSEISKTLKSVTIEKKVGFSMTLSKSPFTQNRRYWDSNVKFIEKLGKRYTSTNDIYGIDVDDNILLGDVIDADIDNIGEQFEGSLMRGSITKLNRVDEVILTSDTGAGRALITCNGSSATAVWNTSLTQTALDFINDHNSDFPGVNVSTGGDGIIRFTHATAGVEFSGPTTIVNTIFDLDGYISQTQPSLSSADYQPTESWSTRSGSESKALLQLVADETARMYERPKSLIQMPIWETAKDISLDIIGSFGDALYLYNSAIRIFCMNRGSFKPRDREWTIDLFEIGTGTIVGETTLIKYGFLYNWPAASEIDYLIAAEGWHLPTLEEAQTLIDYHGGNEIAGTKMRETGSVYWDSEAEGFIEGTNDYGFNIRGAGLRQYFMSGEFIGLRINTAMWLNAFAAIGFVVNADMAYAEIIEEEESKKSGAPIRLIKDSTTLSHGETGTYTGNDGKVYRTICIGTQEWLADNLAETQYRGGDPIPNVTDAGEWVALETGAYCAYDNDIDNAYTVETITSATADSTLVTADSTLITSDSTI